MLTYHTNVASEWCRCGTDMKKGNDAKSHRWVVLNVRPIGGFD